MGPAQAGNDTAAALAAAWHLPEHLERIAVGTSDPLHLTELAAAAQLPVAPGMIRYYRQQLDLVRPTG